MNVFDKPQSYDGNEPYIFISYSHKKETEIYNILYKLNEKGVRFWYDDGLKHGVEWDKEVLKKIKAARFVWFFFDENFLISHSLKKEVLIAKENKIPYEPIYYTGFTFEKIFYNKINSGAEIDPTFLSLYYEVFNNKITGIVLDNQIDFIDALIRQSINLNVISDSNIVNKKKSTKTVAMIAKDSVFTSSIMEGIIKVFSSNEEVALSVNLIDPSSIIPQDIQLKQVFESILISRYDGVIIRPLGEMDVETFELFSKICKKTKVVLCDVDITSTQRKSLGEKAPVYVCSDFENGGMKIGNYLIKLAYIFGVELTDLFVCTGPEINEPAKLRSNKIAEIIKNSNIRNALFLELDSLDVVDCLDKITKTIKQNLTPSIKDRFLLLYAGNDNVALYFAKHIDSIKKGNIELRKYKKIIIFGYDGIKGITTNSILEESKFEYVTMDTIPYHQGEVVANTLLKAINNDLLFDNVKVKPSIISKVCFKPRVESCLKKVSPLIKNADLFIFDLDGTLADTETFHWMAYNVLLKKKYGFELSEEHIKRYIGNSEMNIYEMINMDFGVSINKEEFLRERLEIYLELVNKKSLKPFQWVNEFISTYKDVPILLLTSQVPKIVNYLLEIWKLDKLIPLNHRISCHDGKITKSEVFATPAKYIDLSYIPQNVVVFEDSDHVAKLALEKQHTVIGVRHRYNKDSLYHVSAIIDSKIKKGLYIGLGGIDLVYYINSLPFENNKCKSEKYEIKVGGPALNAAISCAKLGGDATLLIGLGDHPLADIVRQTCEKFGVKVIDIMPQGNIPNISSVAVNLENATRTIISGQKNDDDIILPAASFFSGFDYCLYDCNLPKISKKLVDILSSYRVELVLDCGAWKGNIERCLIYSTVAITSSNFKSLDNENIFEIKEKYRNLYKTHLNLNKIAITRGGDSILFQTEENDGEVMVNKKVKVNTLGAGDILHGAFCYYYYDLNNDFKTALELASLYATNMIS